MAELARTARPGGSILVVDQLAPVDPLAALELNRFERARDPSTTRVLADVDLRGLFEANGLVMRRVEFVQEDRDLDSYLDLAGCEGDARERARALVPQGYRASVGGERLPPRRTLRRRHVLRPLREAPTDRVRARRDPRLRSVVVRRPDARARAPVLRARLACGRGGGPGALDGLDPARAGRD